MWRHFTFLVATRSKNSSWTPVLVSVQRRAKSSPPASRPKYSPMKWTWGSPWENGALSTRSHGSSVTVTNWLKVAPRSHDPASWAGRVVAGLHRTQTDRLAIGGQREERVVADRLLEHRERLGD